MERILNPVARLRRRRDDGASAVEYGLLVALIAVVIAGAVAAVGIAVVNQLNNTASCVSSSGTVCTVDTGDDGGGVTQ